MNHFFEYLQLSPVPLPLGGRAGGVRRGVEGGELRRPYPQLELWGALLLFPWRRRRRVRVGLQSEI